MKFRNPDTNQIFVDIYDAHADFCNDRDCDTDCPLDAPTCKDGYQSCSVWAIHHPVEAAHLMGYEIVEDTIKTVQGHESLTAEQQKNMAEFIDSKLTDKEEANMDKPRICEVLGVEVNEQFDFCMYNGLYVDKAGYVRTNKGVIIGGDALCLLFNEPSYIVRKPRWTEKEVEAAEAILTLWPDATILEDGRPYYIRVHGKDRLLNTVDLDLFPSIQPGQSVKLSEICGGIHDGEGGE